MGSLDAKHLCVGVLCAPPPHTQLIGTAHARKAVFPTLIADTPQKAKPVKDSKQRKEGGGGKGREGDEEDYPSCCVCEAQRMIRQAYHGT